MTQLILFLVIAALCSLVGWLDYNNRKERKTYLNAILAKNAREMADLELAGNTKIEAKPSQEPPDLVPLDQVDDKTFQKAIEGVE